MLSVPTAAMAYSQPSTNPYPVKSSVSSSTTASDKMDGQDWIGDWTHALLGNNFNTTNPTPSQPSQRTITSKSNAYLTKDANGTIKAVQKVTYSNGDTEIVDAKSNGLMSLNGAHYWMKNGKVDTSFSGTKSAHHGTYTISKGKVTGVKFAVPKSSQMPKYPTGCEGSSMNSFLRWYGYNVNLDECINAIPRENVVTRNGKRYGPSIYEKFAGNPRAGYTSKYPGYGAFAPVITKSLNKVIKNHGGTHTAKDITGASPSTLYKNLRDGKVMIVWCTYNMKTPTTRNSWYVKNSQGKWVKFSYPRGTHVVVLRGYDKNNVYIMDSYNGTYKTFSRSSFESKYKLLWSQAIVMDRAR